MEAIDSVQTGSPVSVKGLKDGLLFVLDEQCEFEILIEHLGELLGGENSAVFDGPQVTVSIDYGNRTMTAEESQRLLRLFLEKENFFLREWGPHTDSKRVLLQSRTRNMGPNIFKGTVRAGQRFVYDGDVVIVGDINPGGEVAATGDIYVFGKLAGIAHAGVTGNQRAVIAAAEFAPMQLRISGVVSRAPEAKGRALHTFMEFAYLREDGMAVDKTQFMSSIRSRRSE